MTSDVKIEVEQYFFPQVHVTANPAYNNPDSTPVDAEIESDIDVKAIEGNDGSYVAELRVMLDADDGETLPYSIDVVCLCFMKVEGPHAEDEKKLAAAELGHRVMFPAIRELVLTITARQPWGQFSIGFSALKDISAESAPHGKRKATPKKKAKEETV